ncbi:MAG TPA: HAD-IB family hydrolase [Actinomycetota bacterium]|nr:HAD-IB family hydrolase [Actinomycetota bacterium]
MVEAAFFDLDKTIVARSSPLALSKTFFREGLLTRGSLLKGLYAQLVFHLMGADEKKMERMREEAAKLTAGWEQDKVRQVVTEVLEDVISPLIYAEALELMEQHRAAGRLVCIVSSSPEEIVEPMSQMLAVDHWIATKPQVVDGRYTGELEFYAYGPAKAEAIERLANETGIDLDGSFAYSDSPTDLPMLELVGHPVPVNPDRALRRIASERGWTVENFRNPVSLRSRLPQFPQLPSMPRLSRPELERKEVAVAGATVAALGLVTWWVSRRTSSRSG